MSEYSRLVEEFEARYELPTVEKYIVGFSGIDPDKKIIPSEIQHNQLGGLMGGDSIMSSYYHLTYQKRRKTPSFSYGDISRNKVSA